MLDDAVLSLQRVMDRMIRWLRRGAAAERTHTRLLIVQIDGLSRLVLARVLASGDMPFLARVLNRHGYELSAMSVGLPTCTPSFQMAAMYGVRPDIPGFHYYDRARKGDTHFPRPGHAAWVEARQASGQRGILHAGSAYGCVFTVADNSLFSFATLTRPTGRGVVSAAAGFVVLGWVIVTPTVYVSYLDYDVAAHAFGPESRTAIRALRRVDRAIRQIWRVRRRVPEHRYDLYVLADHGQAASRPYRELTGGRRPERWIFDQFLFRESAGDPDNRTRSGPGRGVRAQRT
jgi:predicted AlkP superfamily pyrophosphatase or phosphodiesterase